MVDKQLPSQGGDSGKNLNYLLKLIVPKFRPMENLEKKGFTLRELSGFNPFPLCSKFRFQMSVPRVYFHGIYCVTNDIHKK